MTLSLVDRDGRSTAAAAEGQVALASGDTPRAREKFAEAGAILEQQLPNARKQSEKHLVRFLAASQYYKGGHYRKALALCLKVEARLLPPEVRSLFPGFQQDVRSRTAPAYESRVQRELADLWRAGRAERLLELLQDHPYVLPPGTLAFFRAGACEKLKDYRAAAVFYADAFRKGVPEDPGVVVAPAVLPLHLARQGRLEEAWDYVRHQLDLIRHPVTFITASLLSYHRASGAEGEVRQQRSAEQIRYFEEAWKGYRELPSAQSSHPEVRAYMAFCFEAAAFGLLRLRDEVRAREVTAAAIDFAPNSPGPWTVRGILHFPSPESVAAFRKAVSLRDTMYFSFYHLALDALSRNDFREALPYCEEALARQPGPRIAAQLYGWLALCRDHLGGSPEEVEGLFRKALELDAENPEVLGNYRQFRARLESPTPRTATTWQHSPVRHGEEQYLSERESHLVRSLDPAAPVRRELQTAGAG
jgi:tetratricopeptide (TPR) repeat protein